MSSMNLGELGEHLDQESHRVVASCKLSIINSHYFNDYCKRMQIRKPDLVRMAVLEYLKKRDVPVDLEDGTYT
jgi:hypothetical protein